MNICNWHLFTFTAPEIVKAMTVNNNNLDPYNIKDTINLLQWLGV